MTLDAVSWIFTPHPGAYPCALTFTCEPEGLTCRQDIAGLHTPRSGGVVRLGYDEGASDPVGWIRNQILGFLDTALKAN
jgi:hypothetical protein